MSHYEKPAATGSVFAHSIPKKVVHLTFVKKPAATSVSVAKPLAIFSLSFKKLNTLILFRQLKSWRLAPTSRSRIRPVAKAKIVSAERNCGGGWSLAHGGYRGAWRGEKGIAHTIQRATHRPLLSDKFLGVGFERPFSHDSIQHRLQRKAPQAFLRPTPALSAEQGTATSQITPRRLAAGAEPGK